MADPCLSCGACCASFRVDFHVSDLDSQPGGCVPVALTLPVTATLYRMRGTDDGPPRCIALAGDIGGEVHCTIYDRRPGPCRDFAPYAALGIGDHLDDPRQHRIAADLFRTDHQRPGLVQRTADDLGVLIFAQTKKHCAEIASALPPGSWAIITDDTPDKERAESLAKAKTGEIK